MLLIGQGQWMDRERKERERKREREREMDHRANPGGGRLSGSKCFSDVCRIS